MMAFKRTSIFQWLIAALALVPVSLFAYLGQFSRLIWDDYCIISRGREMGAWDYMIYKLNTWGGGYANWFLKGAMAPLDTLAARITPTLIIVLWLIGLSWLVFQVLTYLKIDHSRRALSVALSALIVAATIHAFYTTQSFYWYSASTQNVLPLALLTIYMALTLWTAQRSRLSLLAVIAGGLLCFIAAGSGEPFVAFQAIFLTLCLLSVFAFLPAPRRRGPLVIFGVGWLVTLAGLVIQLSSPGIARRAVSIEEHYEPSFREMLLTRTLGWTFDSLGHPQIFLGFVMLMAVGLLVMLVKYKPQPVSKAAPPAKLALPLLWMGLIFQLVWLPLLWLHISDNPQFLGRFSSRYMAVVLFNAVFILSFLVLLWQRKRIQAALQERERGLLTVGYIMALMFIFAALFAVTQLSVSSRISYYLFTSLLVVLVLLTWELSSLFPSGEARRFGLLALCLSGIGLVCMTALVFMGLYGHAHALLRIRAPAAYLLVLPGLVWGVYMGWLLKHYGLSSQAGRVWSRLLERGSLAVVLIIVMGIVQSQAALIPDFRLYAREWDVQHQEIIAMRDSGQTAIEVAPLTWRLDIIMERQNLSGCTSEYYGVDLMRPADT